MLSNEDIKIESLGRKDSKDSGGYLIVDNQNYGVRVTHIASGLTAECSKHLSQNRKEKTVVHSETGMIFLIPQRKIRQYRKMVLRDRPITHSILKSTGIRYVNKIQAIKYLRELVRNDYGAPLSLSGSKTLVESWGYTNKEVLDKE